MKRISALLLAAALAVPACSSEHRQMTVRRFRIGSGTGSRWRRMGPVARATRVRLQRRASHRGAAPDRRPADDGRDQPGRERRRRRREEGRVRGADPRLHEPARRSPGRCSTSGATPSRWARPPTLDTAPAFAAHAVGRTTARYMDLFTASAGNCPTFDASDRHVHARRSARTAARRPASSRTPA